MLEVDIRVAFSLPVSGPLFVQNCIHYFALYLLRFGLQANVQIGPTDFPLSICTHACLCLYVHTFPNKSPFKAQPCYFTVCTFYGSWKITTANVLGRKHTALPQNLVLNLLSSHLQNLNLLTFPVMYSFLI